MSSGLEEYASLGVLGIHLTLLPKSVSWQVGCIRIMPSSGLIPICRVTENPGTLKNDWFCGEDGSCLAAHHKSGTVSELLGLVV